MTGPSPFISKKKKVIKRLPKSPLSKKAIAISPVSVKKQKHARSSAATASAHSDTAKKDSIDSFSAPAEEDVINPVGKERLTQLRTAFDGSGTHGNPPGASEVNSVPSQKTKLNESSSAIVRTPSASSSGLKGTRRIIEFTSIYVRAETSVEDDSIITIGALIRAARESLKRIRDATDRNTISPTKQNRSRTEFEVSLFAFLIRSPDFSRKFPCPFFADHTSSVSLLGCPSRYKAIQEYLD